MDSFKTRELAD